MDDLISRQAAYDVLTDYYHQRTEIQHKALKEALSRVPSADSELINELDFGINASTGDSAYMVGLRNGLRLAKSYVDGSDPQFEEYAERKTGKWIYCEDDVADCVDGYKCNKCGLFVPWDYQHKGIDFIEDYNFCPHCGFKMEVTT